MRRVLSMTLAALLLTVSTAAARDRRDDVQAPRVPDEIQAPASAAEIQAPRSAPAV